MARWKLTEPHYLSVPGEEWERTAIDVRTGKTIRKKVKVPKHLDPRIEDDWNFRPPQNPMDGEIHVCWADKGLPHDIVFEGNPTPGMLPLDDEAKEISGRFDWKPTQGIDEESQRAGFYALLGDKLIAQLTDLKATVAVQPQIHGVEKLLEAMAAMMLQNQQLMAMLAGKPAPAKDELAVQAEALGETQPVYDLDEPLPDTEPTEAELAEAAVAAAAKEAASNQKAQNHVMGRRI